MNLCNRMGALEHAAIQAWVASRGALERQRIDGALEGDCISKLLAIRDRGGVESLSRIARSALDIIQNTEGRAT